MHIVAKTFKPNLIIRKQSGWSGRWGLRGDMSMSGKTKAGTVLDERGGRTLDNHTECLIFIWILI